MFKKIKTIIEPLNLDEIKKALEELGIKEGAISKHKNFKPQKGKALVFRGKKQTGDSLPEIRLKMGVDQETAARVVESLRKVDGAGWDKDGRITVLSIEEIISNGPFNRAGWSGFQMGT